MNLNQQNQTESVDGRRRATASEAPQSASGAAATRRDSAFCLVSANAATDEWCERASAEARCPGEHGRGRGRGERERRNGRATVGGCERNGGEKPR